MLDKLYAAASGEEPAPPTYTYVDAPDHGVGGSRNPDNATIQNLSEAHRDNGIPLHLVPDQVRQSIFAFDGRAQPFAGVPVASWLNIKATQAVMRDTFGVALKIPVKALVFLRNGYGGQATLGTRSVIERPGTQSFGDMTAVAPGGYAGYTQAPAVNVNGMTLDPGGY